MVSGPGLRCDWYDCQEGPTHYLQLGESTCSGTSMFVCDAHYRIGLMRLMKARGDKNWALGAIRVTPTYRR